MDPAFLFGHLDPANRFAMEGLNMAFAAELHRDGKPLPKLLFIDVMVEKNTEINRIYQSTSSGTFINCQYRRKFGCDQNV